MDRTGWPKDWEKAACINEEDEMRKILNKKQSMIRKSAGDRITDIAIYLILGLIAVCALLPFLYVLAGSFATDKELTEKSFFIIPEVWSLNATNMP